MGANVRKQDLPVTRVDAWSSVGQDALNINVIRYRWDDDERDIVQEYAQYQDAEFTWVRYSGYDVLEVPTLSVSGLMEHRGDVVDEELLERLHKLARQTRHWSDTRDWLKS